MAHVFKCTYSYFLQLFESVWIYKAFFNRNCCWKCFNIILNSVFLFVFNWGVMGVAVATVISRVVNLIIVAGMGAVLIKAKQSPERITSRKIFAQIVKIGFSFCA